MEMLPTDLSGGAITGLSWLTVGSFGSCERGNDPSGFRKLGEFHDLLSNC